MIDYIFPVVNGVRTVVSIVKSIGQNITLIDIGSSTKTGTTFQQIASNYYRFDKFVGFPKVFNKGIDLTKNEFIACFLVPTIFDVRLFENEVTTLLRRGNIGAVVSYEKGGLIAFRRDSNIKFNEEVENEFGCFEDIKQQVLDKGLLVSEYVGHINFKESIAEYCYDIGSGNNQLGGYLELLKKEIQD